MKYTIVHIKSLRFWSVLLLFMVFMCLQYQPVWAQGDVPDSTSELSEDEKISEVWGRFSLNFGGFFAGYNSGLSIGLEQLGAGIQIDLEDALGLSTSGWVIRGNTNFNFGKSRRHSVMLGYFDINRNASKILEDSLQIGDFIYPVGEEVSTKFDLTIIRAKYGYAFLHDDRISLAVSGGFFILPITFSIKATGLDEQKGDIIAPLPVIGLSIDVRLTKKLYLRQSSELLYLATSSFSGGILDLNFRLAHKTFKHFGFGIDINSTQITVKTKADKEADDNFIGNANMSYTGVALFGSYYF